jgi:hypothetical protein
MAIAIKALSITAMVIKAGFNKQCILELIYIAKLLRNILKKAR